MMEREREREERQLLGVELEILHYPDPALKRPTESVTGFDDGLAAFVEKMFAAMRASEGVGLAAPQVGVSKKIAVVEHEGASYVLIDPRIIDQGGEQEGEEGCLSFPGIYAPVKRPAWAKVEARDVEGETHVYDVSGFLARAFLHEMDHLDGKLFIDHLSGLKRSSIRKKMLKQKGDRQG